MARNLLVVACSKGGGFAESLAKRLGARHSALSVETFPDGETKIRFAKPVKGRVVALVQSLHPKPNDALMELLFALSTAGELGARKTIAVVPYFAYARQDSRFKPGEVVSNRIVAGMIEEAGAGAFVTVATHLHRIPSLSRIFRKIPARNVTLGSEIAAYYRRARSANAAAGRRGLLVVGPDAESKPMAKEIAGKLGCGWYVFLKKRLSGTAVRNIMAPGLECRGRDVLLVDDMVSTGNTLASVAAILKAAGAKRVDCVAVHLLDKEGGGVVLKEADSFACSNTLRGKFSRIDASQAAGREIGLLLEKTSG